jgi:manganese transport protein
LVAIVPAVIVIGLRGSGGVNDLLVLSQVVLALQLPFAMFPLLHLTGRRDVMGDRRNGWLLAVLGWGSALFITAMDFYGLPGAVSEAARMVMGH